MAPTNKTAVEAVLRSWMAREGSALQPLLHADHRPGFPVPLSSIAISFSSHTEDEKTEFKIGALPDERPVKISVELPASVHRDLLAYAKYDRLAALQSQIHLSSLEAAPRQAMPSWIPRAEPMTRATLFVRSLMCHLPRYRQLLIDGLSVAVRLWQENRWRTPDPSGPQPRLAAR
jgi:hypothetical protein